MLLEWIRLRHIKTHEETEAVFAPGVNAICGRTGAGKSTLLEAIGFALFDHLPYTHEEFKREGERTGTVAVGIRSRLDERPYEVVRSCGKGAEWSVFDPATGASLVRGKEDVLDWLKAHLRIGLGGRATALPLPTLFKEAIGVSQGLLAAPFLLSPATRKDLFAPLLGMDDFEAAASHLKGTEKQLEDRRQAALIERSGLTPQVERLSALRSEHEGLQKTAASLREALGRITTETHALEAELKAEVTRHQRLEALSTRLAALSGEIERLSAERTLRGAEITRSREAQRIVEESGPDYRAYTAAKAELLRLEEKRAARDTLKDRLATLQQQRERLVMAEGSLAARLEELVRLKAEIEGLTPQAARQGALETELKALTAQGERLRLIEEQAAAERKKLPIVEREVLAMREAVASRVPLEAELVRLEASRAQLLREAAGLEAELKQTLETGERLKTQRDRLAQGEGGSCPLCRQELSADHLAHALADYETELSALRSRYRELHQGLLEKKKALDAAEEGARQARERLAALPRPEQLPPMERWLLQQQEALARLEAEREGMKGIPERLGALHRELTALGDPRGRIALHGEALKGEARVLAERERTVRDREAVDAEVAKAEAALRPFGDLDARIQGEHRTQERCEAGYHRLIANAGEAGKLEPLLALMADLEPRLARARESREETLLEHGSASTGFDPARRPALELTLQEKIAERSQASTRLEEAESRLKTLSLELKDLEAKERRLAELQVELARTERLQGRAAFAREVVRKAGPKVVSTVTGLIGHEASRLYAELLGDHGASLQWSETFGISVTHGSRQRGFKQLSGGEQMSAALAVRLAILKEMSGIDMVFFDEPTPHLDAGLREKLAEQIGRIRGLGQIIVISHDATFERVTEHVITIEKEREVSRIHSEGPGGPAPAIPEEPAPEAAGPGL